MDLVSSRNLQRFYPRQNAFLHPRVCSKFPHALSVRLVRALAMADFSRIALLPPPCSPCNHALAASLLTHGILKHTLVLHGMSLPPSVQRSVDNVSFAGSPFDRGALRPYF